MQKSERARERQFIQVFLSHKQKDHGAAEAICEVLQTNSAGRIRVFMAEEIEKGALWQQEIERQLYASDWFLLLFTGVDEDDWSWCHHEAGVFCGMMYPDANRVIVFHPPNVTLPDPLRKYQAVKCETTPDGESEDLDRFFEDMFSQAPYPDFPPINPFFMHRGAEASRRAAAANIVKAVGRLVVESIAPETTLVLHVPHADLHESSGFPESTRIRRGSPAMRLFELGDTGFEWQSFQERLEPVLRDCLERSFWPGVHAACARSVRSRRLAPTHTVMRSPADNRHYMPMISRVEIAGDGGATFTLTFVQVAAGTQAEVRDKSVARIFTMLNLAHRFRWEIIDPYKDPVRLQKFIEHHAGADARTGLAAIWEAIRLIELELTNRGINDPVALPADFGPGARERISAMFPWWAEQRQRLEAAVAAGDVTGFAAILARLDEVNVEFIGLVSARLGELVRADAAQTPAAA